MRNHTLSVVTPQAVQELQNARYQLKIVDAVSGAVITDPLTVTFVGTPVLKAADGMPKARPR
jgi:hypothetical protein